LWKDGKQTEAMKYYDETFQLIETMIGGIYEKHQWAEREYFFQLKQDMESWSANESKK
jgi:hypothetical protein